MPHQTFFLVFWKISIQCSIMAVLTPSPTSVIWKPHPLPPAPTIVISSLFDNNYPDMHKKEAFPCFNIQFPHDYGCFYVFFWKLLTRFLVHFFIFLFVVAIEFFSCFGYQSLMSHKVCKLSLLAYRLSFHIVPFSFANAFVFDVILFMLLFCCLCLGGGGVRFLKKSSLKTMLCSISPILKNSSWSHV